MFSVEMTPKKIKDFEKYPKLMKHKHSDTIVLCTSLTNAIVIKTTYFMNWHEGSTVSISPDAFEDFHGVVTLTIAPRLYKFNVIL